MPTFSLATDCYHARHATLLSTLHHLAEQTPDNDFLIEDIGQSLTYQQSYILASALLPPRLLRICPSLSSPRQRKVVLISANNALFPLTLWALWFMSFTAVPISVKSEPSLWSSMVSSIDPDALIISSSLKEVAAQHLQLPADLDVTYLENLIPAQFAMGASPSRVSDFIPSLINWLSKGSKDALHEKLNDPPLVEPEAPVISLFTSSAVDASTIKYVTYTHSMLIHSAARMVEMLGGPSYGARPVRHLGWLSLSHCFEFCISLLGIVLETGGSYVFFDREVSSPEASLSTPLHTQLLRAIQYHRPVDSLCIVPAIFSDMVKDMDAEGLRDIKAMRSLGVGGAPTSEEVFQWAAENGVAYFDCSGATEAAGTICIRRAAVQSMRDYGLEVAPGLEGFLEKDSAEDSFGELVVRGAFIPAGYDNRESSAFVKHPGTGWTIYRTGDLYEQDQKLGKLQSSSSYLKGETIPEPEPDRPRLSGLKYIGRIDDMVVLASGIKIDALAIERKLNEHHLILRSAIVTNLTGEAPVVLLQPAIEPNTPFDARAHEEVVRFVLDINRSLAFDKRFRPENVIVVDELPVTAKLTLNRKKVKKIWSESKGDWPGTKVGKVDVDAHRIHDQLQLRAETRRAVENLLSDVFDIPVDHLAQESINFSKIPLTSLSSVQLARALEVRFSARVSAAQLYSFRSVDDICDLILGANQAPPKDEGLHQDRDSSSSDSTKVPNPTESGESLLVITGAACRYPGQVRSLDDLWAALLDPQTYNKKVLKHPPASRWATEISQENDIPPIAWLEDDVFDNLSLLRDFFNLSPGDVKSMSPNARLALQLGYQAIEDAGFAPRSLDGQAWGVFSSVNSSGWRERRSSELSLDEYSASLLGSADDAVGARLSYFLNLEGPAIEVKTACSSSAVAVHQACCSIRNGDCDAAIVISSTTHFHPSGPIFRSKAGIASKLGRCATFSDEADGFLPGEGAAAIVIQRAVNAKCVPYASIKATNVTQDGRSHGFFAPNPAAQTRLIRQTLKKALCSEQDIDLIETHGTGTQLGDAVEMQALAGVFRDKRSRPLIMSSVKAVLGHTEEVAGLTGILKSILCLRHGVVPAQPNFVHPNRQIDFGSSKFTVPRRIISLPRIDRPRRVGISSFGLSGTLAHTVLEDFTGGHTSRPISAPSLFLLSAHDRSGFKLMVKRYLDFAMMPDALEAEFKAICMTSQIARDHLPLRRAWHVHDHNSWIQALSEELREPRPYQTIRSGGIKLGIWFGLPLRGKSLTGGNCLLLDHEQALVVKGGWDDHYSAFAQQLAVANMLKGLGCDISAVGGEGIAEWVAGVYAGLLPMNSVFQKANRDGLGIYVVQGSKAKVTELLTQWLPSELALRGSYSNDFHALEGTAEAVKEFAETGDVALFSDVAVSPEPPQKTNSLHTLPIVSGHLGEILDRDMLGSSTYWAHAGRRYFDAGRGVNCLAGECDVVLHLGGSSLGLDTATYVHPGSGSLENVLGELHERGCDIDWAHFGPDGQRVHLPVHQW